GEPRIMNSIQACRVWFALLLFPILIGCRGEPGFLDSSGQKIQATVFASGTQTGVAESGLVLCRNAKEWSELWARHMELQDPESPLPVVSFSNENVLAVFLGDRPTAGYSISVVGLESRSRGWVLHTREKKPNEDLPQLQVETRPYTFLIVPNHVEEVDWNPDS
ncbi:MAG: protease complex subunit PrcB family protein, partial [Planctomycetota bacterium]|nr:protease complex subunit PrcB family protein [Planctomycetota bacterium]